MKKPPNMTLNWFCVGHLLLDEGIDLKSSLCFIPSETAMKQTNFFYL